MLSVHCRSYMRTMRHKLGLLLLERDSDEQLVQDLLQVSFEMCLIAAIVSSQAFRACLASQSGFGHRLHQG